MLMEITVPFAIFYLFVVRAIDEISFDICVSQHERRKLLSVLVVKTNNCTRRLPRGILLELRYPRGYEGSVIPWRFRFRLN